MAIIHGKAGSVTFSGGDFTVVKSWSADVSIDIEDTSGMGAETFKTKTAGLKDWTADVECVFSVTGLAALGTSATLTLTRISGSAMSGMAILAGYGEGSTVEGVVTQTYKFEGSGTLS